MNFLVSDTKFKFKVTGRVYNIRGKLTCTSPNVVYLISCSNCDDLYVGSVLEILKVDLEFTRVILSP